MTLAFCLTAIFGSMLAPASNTQISCFAKSTNWCAEQSGSFCDDTTWYFTAQKRQTYTCSGTTVTNLHPVFILYMAPCCSTIEPEPADPVATCSPCPSAVREP